MLLPIIANQVINNEHRNNKPDHWVAYSQTMYQPYMYRPRITNKLIFGYEGVLYSAQVACKKEMKGRRYLLRATRQK